MLLEWAASTWARAPVPPGGTLWRNRGTAPAGVEPAASYLPGSADIAAAAIAVLMVHCAYGGAGAPARAGKAKFTLGSSMCLTMIARSAMTWPMRTLILLVAVGALGCGSPQTPDTPPPATTQPPAPEPAATAAPTAAASTAAPAAPAAPCEKKSVDCEHSELAKLVAQGWQVDSRPENHDELLEAALRQGPLFVAEGGPEIFDACIVTNQAGLTAAQNRDAETVMPGFESPTSKRACLVVYTDTETAASDCHLKPKSTTIAEIAKLAARDKVGITVTCKQFFKTIFPKEVAGYVK